MHGDLAPAGPAQGRQRGRGVRRLRARRGHADRGVRRRSAHVHGAAAEQPAQQPAQQPAGLKPAGHLPARRSRPRRATAACSRRRSSPGARRLRGPSGCVKQAFRARVSGRSIASVDVLDRRQEDQDALRGESGRCTRSRCARASTASAVTSSWPACSSRRERHELAPPPADVPPLRAGARSPPASPAETRNTEPDVPGGPCARGRRPFRVASAPAAAARHSRHEGGDQAVGLVLLGMPQHAEHEAAVGVLDGLDGAVACARAVTRSPSPSRATPWWW